MDMKEEDLEPLGNAIRHSLLPELTGQQSISDADFHLLQLPVRDGGLALPDMSCMPQKERSSSTRVTRSLVDVILAEDSSALPTSSASARQCPSESADGGRMSPDESATAAVSSFRQAITMCIGKNRRCTLKTGGQRQRSRLPSFPIPMGEQPDVWRSYLRRVPLHGCQYCLYPSITFNCQNGTSVMR